MFIEKIKGNDVEDDVALDGFADEIEDWMVRLKLSKFVILQNVLELSEELLKEQILEETIREIEIYFFKKSWNRVKLYC